ncbi:MULTISPECIES: hypothetical protein [unclassified Bradyrhizobium]|uniref:hypothetical protein n=1 Tax=unclassified Bradyrhizobium TaxID=2631580 RepID=UPI001FF7CD4A|nr:MULTISPECIES: hypothetical protein [unclassified Bradyrhizobium]MCK1533159.1 hypothetical protein [Bradyrhizobium sp. 176]MCK1558269.1 hypothetical protein [Bradyrhizobium sp. 171]
MNPFKSIILSLQATGISAIVCVWIVCMTLLAIFAPNTPGAKTAMTILSIFGGALMTAMAFRRD